MQEQQLLQVVQTLVLVKVLEQQLQLAETTLL